MSKTRSVRLAIVVLRIALGLLFIYGGIKKFMPPKPRPEAAVSVIQQEPPAHIVKIRAFIGGLKQSGYFWSLLGATELVCGLLLVSQYLSLLGAVMLVPVTLNIFLFHAFLEPHEPGEMALTGLYLLGNLLLLAYGYPKLKYAFLTKQ